MITFFMLSMIGQALVQRSLANIAREFAISQRSLRSLMILNFFAIALIAAITQSTVSLWLFFGILLISLKLFPEIFRIFLIQRLQFAVIPMLDNLVLGIQAGKSFRQSLHMAIESQSGWQRNQLREIYNSIVTSENKIAVKSAVIKDLQAELLEIDRSQTRSLDQAKALRRQYKVEENFRRRSGQVTQQIKMQAIIVTALYGALLAFVFAQFGFMNHRFLILGSLFMFVFGLFIIFSVGRRIKWKV
ncbi:hypothetical protein [Bdellovibrio sp. KM01]|uniref:hypothetical protein n=1 Tax=Bdellovibrio sp. KM01 TaxID=2748865 RepID=UPI0015EA346F|nr:hypothetical protein [Bdellovibrio sp. KM01]QLY25385.1 hypothetical protein HW988_18560 [Bdellovibrio sp. KM01]